MVLVHNGIIENFQELRQELSDAGHSFQTETDTEAVVRLINSYLAAGKLPAEAVAAALKRLEGAFALAILFAGHDDMMIAARRGSPLAIGYGDGEMYIGSDALALAPLTQQISYLDEGDWAEITAEGAVVHDETDAVVTREIQHTSSSGAMTGKGNFPHFMLKEIFEQPAVIGDTLQTILNPWNEMITLPELPFDLTKIPRVTIVACGTSYHAGMVARYWFETVAGVPCDIDIASEFRYRTVEMRQGGMSLFISQSGETADTLAALRYAKEQGQHIVSVVNVAESSMARESDAILQTKAGPEIGVASTKAFTTQLTTLACFVIGMAAARGRIDREQESALCHALTEVPSRANDVLNHDEAIKKLAHEVMDARDLLYPAAAPAPLR